jgi:hypothetical protein
MSDALTKREKRELTTYARLESRIRKGDLDALIARWQFGRELLAKRGDKAKLPDGYLDQLCNALHNHGGRRELQNRMQFAEQYSTEAEVRAAFEEHGSWSEICARGMGDRGAAALAPMEESPTVPVALLRPHPKHYRQHPPEQLAHLVASIEEFGVYKPVLAIPNRGLVLAALGGGGIILAGHGIVEAAKHMGLTHVPVTWFHFPTPNDPRALKLLVADNEISNVSDDDPRALTDMLSNDIRPDDDLLGTGYDDMQLTNRIFVTRPRGEVKDYAAAAKVAGMPAYEQQPEAILLHLTCETEAYREEATKRLGVEPRRKEARAWSASFPDRLRARLSDLRWVVEGDAVVPQYPIYVVSKGRADSSLTAKALLRDGVPFKVVVEPQEREAYARALGDERLLILPFSNLGRGSIPARNWIKAHATESGAARHWILDDNIHGFRRMWKDWRIPCEAGPAFAAIEDFADRHENVGIAGMNYMKFGFPKMRAFYLNVHVYSCMLIDNALPLEWRGRYNEDTDLCLQALSSGWCTLLDNQFLADKKTSMTMTGGNTDQLYKGDGRFEMADDLRRAWPGVVQVTREYGRPQHEVRWQVFTTKLVPKPAFRQPTGLLAFVVPPVVVPPNDYGLTLKPVVPREELDAEMRQVLEAWEGTAP